MEWKTLLMHGIVDQRTGDICLFREIIDTEKCIAWERSVCASLVCVQMSVIGMFTRACVCVCVVGVYMCVQQNCNVPARACPCIYVCMHVGVDGDTPGGRAGGGVGAERDRDMFYRVRWRVPKTPMSRVTSFTNAPVIAYVILYSLCGVSVTGGGGSRRPALRNA